jgi:hypothetical protein
LLVGTEVDPCLEAVYLREVPFKVPLGKKSDKNKTRDLAISFHHTIRFLFRVLKTGPGKEGVGLYWRAKNRSGPAWAGSVFNTRSLILANLTISVTEWHGTNATACGRTCWLGF